MSTGRKNQRRFVTGRGPELPDGLVPADGRCVPMNADARARFGLGPEPTSQPDDDDDETARFWGLG